MTADQILELGPALGESLHEFADGFGRREPRGKLEVYVRGQLSTLPRKSAEPMALAAGIRPRSLPEFLASDDGDEDRLRERLQRLVAREHADVQSIGIIDESGHPKKGRETACVPRQYFYCDRSRGKFECQVKSDQCKVGARPPLFRTRIVDGACCRTVFAPRRATGGRFFRFALGTWHFSLCTHPNPANRHRRSTVATRARSTTA